MKILHIQLAGPFSDGWGYQENILTKMQKRQGHQVMVITSQEMLADNHTRILQPPGDYYTKEDKILYRRLAFAGWLPKKLAKRLRVFRSYFEDILEFSPDVIFLHDCMFFFCDSIVKYLHRHPEVRLYVDSHTDLVNSAHSWFSRNILHKLILRHEVKKMEPYIVRLWGTLPARGNFYRDFYGIPETKIRLLPMGLDDSNIDFAGKERVRLEMRKKLGVPDDAFLVVSGGRIENRKRLNVLVSAVEQLQNRQVRLLIFGAPDEKMKEEYEAWKENPQIILPGWIHYLDLYKYLWAADLAVFPGTHSVLWEQAAGCGIPCCFQYWPGFDHVDMGGNCVIREFKTGNDLSILLHELLESPGRLRQMREKAEEVSPFFHYSRIAEQSVL